MVLKTYWALNDVCSYAAVRTVIATKGITIVTSSLWRCLISDDGALPYHPQQQQQQHLTEMMRKSLCDEYALYNACFVSLNRRRKLTADSISSRRPSASLPSTEPVIYSTTSMWWLSGIVASCGVVVVVVVACLSVLHCARRAAIICRVYSHSYPFDWRPIAPQKPLHPALHYITLELFRVD